MCFGFQFWPTLISMIIHCRRVARHRPHEFTAFQQNTASGKSRPLQDVTDHGCAAVRGLNQLHSRLTSRTLGRHGQLGQGSSGKMEVEGWPVGQGDSKLLRCLSERGAMEPAAPATAGSLQLGSSLHGTVAGISSRCGAVFLFVMMETYGSTDGGHTSDRDRPMDQI